MIPCISLSKFFLQLQVGGCPCISLRHCTTSTWFEIQYTKRLCRYKYSARRNGSICKSLIVLYAVKQVIKGETAHLQSMRHDHVLCDRHGRSIVGKWFHCVDCRRDLCAECEDLAEHDSSHVSIVFKSAVDTKVFRCVWLSNYFRIWLLYTHQIYWVRMRVARMLSNGVFHFDQCNSMAP